MSIRGARPSPHHPASETVKRPDQPKVTFSKRTAHYFFLMSLFLILHQSLAHNLLLIYLPTLFIHDRLFFTGKKKINARQPRAAVGGPFYEGNSCVLPHLGQTAEGQHLVTGRQGYRVINIQFCRKAQTFCFMLMRDYFILLFPKMPQAFLSHSCLKMMCLKFLSLLKNALSLYYDQRVTSSGCFQLRHSS